MPSKEEMSKAYIVSVENKVIDMETKIETLKNNIVECKAALEEGESNEESND